MKIENKIRKEERFKKKKWTYQMGSKDLTGSEKFQSKFNQETIARSCTICGARSGSLARSTVWLNIFVWYSLRWFLESLKDLTVRVLKCKGYFGTRQVLTAGPFLTKICQNGIILYFKRIWGYSSKSLGRRRWPRDCISKIIAPNA